MFREVINKSFIKWKLFYSGIWRISLKFSTYNKCNVDSLIYIYEKSLGVLLISIGSKNKRFLVDLLLLCIMFIKNWYKKLTSLLKMHIKHDWKSFKLFFIKTKRISLKYFFVSLNVCFLEMLLFLSSLLSFENLSDLGSLAWFVLVTLIYT